MLSKAIRLICLAAKQLVRHRIRTLLTLLGVASGMFLFTTVETMQRSLDRATRLRAADTTLVVYRENRFCPQTSRLPEFYEDEIRRIPGVREVVPIKITVNNCGASLDVITFRGVPTSTATSRMFAKTSKFACLAAIAAMTLPPLASAEAPGLRPDCAEYLERLRRRPGNPPRDGHACDEAGLNPAVWGDLPIFAAIPDRWRIVTAVGYPENLWDPYNGNNVLKGDRPAFGKDWFFALNLISDSTFEYRNIPTPVPGATSSDAGALDVLGSPDQTAFTQNFLIEAVLYKGETVFKPPDYEIRFLPVINLTRVDVEEPGALFVDPSRGESRSDSFIGKRFQFGSGDA